MAFKSLEKAYRVVSRLTAAEKKMLIEKLISDMSPIGDGEIDVNFYDIKGIGKEIWKDMDAQEYVNKERASWE